MTTTYYAVTDPEPEFAPTHEITLNGRAIPVQLVDGAAYTRAEWDSYSTADWERRDDGAWVFQGQIPVGEYTVRMLKSPPLSGGAPIPTSDRSGVETGAEPERRRDHDA